MLNLAQLLSLIENLPAYRRLVEALVRTDDSLKISILEAAKPYLIGALSSQLQRPILLVTARPETSRKLYEQLVTWGNSGEIKLFPEPDVLPYEQITADNSTQVERLQVLAALASLQKDSRTFPLIVTSAPALMEKTIAHDEFVANSQTITGGMEAEPFQLLAKWQALGYKLESLAEIPGTMSHRGGIIDIYPPTSDLPVRLEFFGNTVESIRLFDPANQRSVRAVPSITIAPVTEGSSRQDSFLNYLPPNGLLILDEPALIKQAVDDLDVKASELRSEKQLPKETPRPYFNWAELETEIQSRQRLTLTAWDIDEAGPVDKLDFTAAPSYAGQLPLFVRKVKELLDRKERVILVSHQSRRLAELLEAEGMIAPPLDEVKQVPPPGSLTLVQGLLAEGWVMGHTYLLTDAEIFGFVKQQRLLKKHPVPHHKLYIDFIPGDYVVHIEHGIARLAGVTTLTAATGEKEYLVLEYAAGDKLYVPTDQIDRVTRYIGATDQPPVLSRLGTQEWTRTKQRVKESVEIVAKELLALYAAREVVPGFAFSPDTVWQQEMESSFPYVETPDQLEAVNRVKTDMEKKKPMDRLVCGDVGYGKTEVALRAAFKAVMDGKQVAMLVPTTVLAEQHYTTFCERTSAFPMKIEVLSRFRTSGEQRIILEGLASGGVDICIGTHRLLQKDVAFKDLGLLIIDEEQRFGVKHKEYLKQKRQEVDVLTLSATPIPRTLHMSLVGVRDMSVMETPPEERLPVKTYVAGYDDRLVREAIIRELERNGQVFFLHNRVQSIAYVAGKLQALVPEARIAIGHGQMPEDKLERVMTEFAQGKQDVLVCTTIVESGLDMPNVNTLIVNQADKFGLTQLYQLRGRVGRGTNLAYAYFLYEKGKMLTPTAEKRLRTIFEATELGAGFGIAMKDLEIRGAGTLLGVHQSGHITAVGFNLYTQLLARAVEELKARQSGKSLEEIKIAHLPPPTIDLPLPAYIPEDYVTDLDTRLGLYQKMARLDKVEQTETLLQEFNDRFGTPPREVKNLLYAIKIKLLAAKAGIASVATEEGEIILRLIEGMRFDTKKLASSVRDGIKIDALGIRLHPKRLGDKWPAVLEDVVRRVG
ncbi:MAG: transcription-repair coupling factor [Chloroflexota bacterium]